VSETNDHPVDRFAPLAAGLLRLDPPPRRLSPLRRIRIIDAGVPGRPTPRRVLLAAIALALAAAVLAPDLVYARRPVVEAELISTAPAALPRALDAAAGVIPAALTGYTATFRLPTDDVRTGPVSPDEHRDLVEGRSTLDVHVMGTRGEQGRPVSGLFQTTRVATAGLLVLLAALAALGALAGLRRGWWMGRLARHGVAVVGRVTEARTERLVRGGRPDGRRNDLYYDFRADGQIREGVVTGFYRRNHVPFEVNGPVRILYQADAPTRSLPADLLPLAAPRG